MDVIVTYFLVLSLLAPSSSDPLCKPVSFDEGTLLLKPSGEVLLKKNLNLNLTNGDNLVDIAYVPSYLAAENLSLSFLQNEANITVWEITLGPVSDEDQILADRYQMSLNLHSRIQGTIMLSLLFRLDNIQWTSYNECRLPSEDGKGFLTSTVCLSNDSHVDLKDMHVLVAKSGCPPAARRGTRERIPLASNYGEPSRSAAGGVVTEEAAIPMFTLKSAVSLAPKERKWLTVGKWLLSGVQTGYQIKSSLSSYEAQPERLLSDARVWQYAKPSTSQIMKAVLDAEIDSEHVILFPGAVKLTSAAENPLVHASAPEWSAHNGVFHLFIPSNLVSLQRRQDNFKEVYEGRVCTEAINLKVANHAKKKVTIQIYEPLFRSTKFTIIGANAPYTITKDKHLHFSIQIEADERKILSYEVKYELD